MFFCKLRNLVQMLGDTCWLIYSWPCVFLLFFLGPPEQFDNWLSSFSLEEKKGEISELLVNSPSIRALYTKMVSVFSCVNIYYYYYYGVWPLVLIWTNKTNKECFIFLSTGASSCSPLRILAEVFLQSLPVGPGKLTLLYYLWCHLLDTCRATLDR